MALKYSRAERVGREEARRSEVERRSRSREAKAVVSVGLIIVVA